MFDRRIAYMGSMLYGAVAAATLILHAHTAFIAVIIVGGSVTSILYWASSPRRRPTRDEPEIVDERDRGIT